MASMSTSWPVTPNPLMTPGEAAALMGVTAQTLRNWERRGHLPAVRIRGQLREASPREIWKTLMAIDSKLLNGDG